MQDVTSLAVAAPEATSLADRLASLPPGSHVCSLYRTAAERDRLALPFLHAGLAAGACCRYVLDEQSAVHLTVSLAAQGVDVAAAALRGQFGILTAKDVLPDRGPFDPHTALAALSGRLAVARADGFPALYYAIEASFLTADEPTAAAALAWEALLEEALFEEALRSLPLVVLCQYDLGRVPSAFAADVRRAHQLVVEDGELVCSPARPTL